MEKLASLRIVEGLFTLNVNLNHCVSITLILQILRYFDKLFDIFKFLFVQTF